MPDGKEWKPCNTSIDMDPHASLTDEVWLIKSQLDDYLKQTESQERNGGLRRKCVSNLLFWIMVVTGCYFHIVCALCLIVCTCLIGNFDTAR